MIFPNIFNALRLNKEKPTPRPPFRVDLDEIIDVTARNRAPKQIDKYGECLSPEHINYIKISAKIHILPYWSDDHIVNFILNEFRLAETRLVANLPKLKAEYGM